MITVALHWWYLPIGIVVVGFVVAHLVPERGDWDFGAAMLKGAIVVGSICVAAGSVFTKLIL